MCIRDSGHALYFTADGIEVRTVEAARGDRPWTRASLLARAVERRGERTLDSGTPPREIDVPFASTPPDPPSTEEPEDAGRPLRGGIP